MVLTPEKRFHTKYVWDELTDCMIWTGRPNHDGYGQYYFQGTMKQAHRVSFFLANGYWPNTARHTCHRRLCIVPHHLLDGVQADSVRDMVIAGRHWNQQKMHCGRNHEYTPENTRYTRTSRYCMACKRIVSAKSRAKKRETGC